MTRMNSSDCCRQQHHHHGSTLARPYLRQGPEIWLAAAIFSTESESCESYSWANFTTTSPTFTLTWQLPPVTYSLETPDTLREESGSQIRLAKKHDCSRDVDSPKTPLHVLLTFVQKNFVGITGRIAGTLMIGQRNHSKWSIVWICHIFTVPCLICISFRKSSQMSWVIACSIVT